PPIPLPPTSSLFPYTTLFLSDDLECSVGIPHTTNPPLGTRYPLVITCRDVKPGTTKVFNVSLRFGPADAGVQDLSGDVLELYAGDRKSTRLNSSHDQISYAVF